MEECWRLWRVRAQCNWLTGTTHKSRQSRFYYCSFKTFGVLKRVGVLAMMFDDKGGAGAADGATVLTNLFNADLLPFSKKKKVSFLAPQRTGVAKQTKQTRTASIESILSLFQRVKLDRCLTFDEACVSIAHADNYDFSHKLLQQGDCVHIVHEDARASPRRAVLHTFLGNTKKIKL